MGLSGPCTKRGRRPRSILFALEPIAREQQSPKGKVDELEQKKVNQSEAHPQGIGEKERGREEIRNGNGTVNENLKGYQRRTADLVTREMLIESNVSAVVRLRLRSSTVGAPDGRHSTRSVLLWALVRMIWPNSGM